jgi:hypothetical protein
MHQPQQQHLKSHTDLVIENSTLKLKVNICSNEVINQITELTEDFKHRLAQMKSQVERLVNDRDTIRVHAEFEKEKANKLIEKYQNISEECSQKELRIVMLEESTIKYKNENTLLQNNIKWHKNELAELFRNIEELNEQTKIAEGQIDCEINHRKILEQKNEVLVEIIETEYELNQIELEEIRHENCSEIKKFNVTAETLKKDMLIKELNQVKLQTIEKLSLIEPIIQSKVESELDNLILKLNYEEKQKEVLIETIKEIKDQLRNLNKEINILEQKKMKLENRIAYLENKLNDLNDAYIQDITEKDLELDKLKFDSDYLISGQENLQKNKQNLKEKITSIRDYLHSKGIHFQSTVLNFL